MPKKSYDYVKKSRALKKLKRSISSSSSSTSSSIKSTKMDNKNAAVQDENSLINIEKSINVYVDDLRDNEQNNKIDFNLDFDACIASSIDGVSSENINSSCILSSDDVSTSDKVKSPQDENSTYDSLSLREKLQNWSINNIFTLRNSAITELLKILHNEGHTELPRTAETLLKTKQFSNGTKIIETAKSNNGMYIYFGIAHVLSLMVKPEIYEENQIEILVNIDGMPIYKSSNKQFWPILIKIYHENYTCKPGIVAIYCGDSKPKSINEFMNDFIEETNRLMENQVMIQNKKYSFSVKGFICDTPARAGCKCCKGHGGFFACERCEIKGVTINKRRVYSQTDCKLRTRESFLNKSQPEHHKKEISPLTRIPDFDPVRQVFLDSMHLFNLGIMKSLFEKYTEAGNLNKLSTKQLNELNDFLKTMSAGIPIEFQRKRFDLKDISNWKATQYQFVLLYALPFLFKKFIPTKKFKHLLLLFVSSRILFSQNLAVPYSHYARSLLKTFFNLMPTMYGKDTQVMNFHNLIHVADDVDYMKAPLSAYSAFPFESCLGQIKKLIRTPNNPLVQVARRLHEIQNGTPEFISKNYLFSEFLKKDLSLSHSLSFSDEVLQVKGT